MNQFSHKYLMPEISSHQDKLALENTELLEEYTIDLDLNKKVVNYNKYRHGNVFKYFSGVAEKYL